MSEEALKARIAELEAALEARYFPYQQTFDAIAAATSLWPTKDHATGISISVRKFEEAFNSHRDAALTPDRKASQ